SSPSSRCRSRRGASGSARPRGSTRRAPRSPAAGRRSGGTRPMFGRRPPTTQGTGMAAPTRTPPYGPYAAIMGAFAGGLAGAGVLSRLLDRNPQCQTALDLGVLSMATFKAARTLARDEVTSFLRDPFVRGRPDDDAGARPPLRTVADVVARRGRAQRLPPSGVRRARPQVERAARARRELDRLQHDDRDPPRRLPLVLRVGRPELDHLRPEAVALLALGDARLDAELLAADLHLRLVALQVVEPRRVALRAPDRGDEDDPVAVAPVQERRRPHLPGLPALRRQQ